MSPFNFVTTLAHYPSDLNLKDHFNFYRKAAVLLPHGITPFVVSWFLLSLSGVAVVDVGLFELVLAFVLLVCKFTKTLLL